MSANPIIRTEDLNMHFRGGKIRALDGVTAQIQKGAIHPGIFQNLHCLPGGITLDRATQIQLFVLQCQGDLRRTWHPVLLCQKTPKLIKTNSIVPIAESIFTVEPADP